MAINFTDFSNKPLLDSPLKNIFENVLKGYQISQEPKKIQQEQSARELANKLKGIEVEHKPKEYELDDKGKELTNAMKEKANATYNERFGLERDLKKAQINKANRPPALQGALAQAFQLKNNLDKNSPTYKEDLIAVDNYINKLGTRSNGIQVNTSPDGGVEVSVGGQGQTANALGLTPLPKGQVYLFDENKKPIGVGKPYTDAEKKEFSGRAAFNIWQKFITDAQNPYSGKGANRQFLDDVRDYSRDETAKQRIDKLLAADKLLFSSTVKEEATLGGANTNQAYNRITHSLTNSEIYPLLQKISTYQLPQGYSKASSDLYNQLLNQGTDAGSRIPAYKPYYFNENKSNADKNVLFKGNMNSNKQKIKDFKSEFKNQEEFNKYYLSLSPEEKKAYRGKIAGENNG